MQAEVGNFSLFFALLLGFGLLRFLLGRELVQLLLIIACLSILLVHFKHIFKFDMALLHLKDDSATLDAIKAVGAANEEFHCGVPQVLLVDILPVNTHDVIVCLHLAKLAHEHVECMLGIDEQLRQVVNAPLGLVFAQSADLPLYLSFCEHVANDL